MEYILFSIEPITKTDVQTIIKFDISVVSVALFQSCKIRVGLYNDKGNLVLNKIISMEGDDYLNWSNDDNYLIDWVKNKISSEFING